MLIYAVAVHGKGIMFQDHKSTAVEAVQLANEKLAEHMPDAGLFSVEGLNIGNSRLERKTKGCKIMVIKERYVKNQLS